MACGYDVVANRKGWAQQGVGVSGHPPPQPRGVVVVVESNYSQAHKQDDLAGTEWNREPSANAKTGGSSPICEFQSVCHDQGICGNFGIVSGCWVFVAGGCLRLREH
jgi:hypothetical protein